MLRDAYRFFETGDGGFLLVRLEDFMELFPKGYSSHLRPEVLESLSLPDKSGTKWIFLKENEQFPSFIKLLATAEGIAQHKIKESITHHRLTSVAELMAFILASTDPCSIDEINLWIKNKRA